MNAILPEIRVCKKCSISKPIESFELKKVKYKDVLRMSRRGTCRKCMNDLYDKPYKEIHRKEYNEYHKNYNAKIVSPTKEMSRLMVKEKALKEEMLKVKKRLRVIKKYLGI